MDHAGDGNLRRLIEEGLRPGSIFQSPPLLRPTAWMGCTYDCLFGTFYIEYGWALTLFQVLAGTIKVLCESTQRVRHQPYPEDRLEHNFLNQRHQQMCCQSIVICSDPAACALRMKCQHRIDATCQPQKHGSCPSVPEQSLVDMYSQPIKVSYKQAFNWPHRASRPHSGCNCDASTIPLWLTEASDILVIQGYPGRLGVTASSRQHISCLRAAMQILFE
ncbi:hypothetical protein BT63DRAFT_424590 [Microthyrium microscopicum]|uniref:Uncharacterized protein n=1 Tax=Microthyrium microscopicum TaxID=703497 RepID=A0A6A6UE86_9PEZI|nr:hypothetical protein BT63DRAFT_424590 [Microthyrium microscopicum]